LELWGFSQNMHLVGETLLVASECGHQDALLLLDVYHLRRGGSAKNSLEYVQGSNIEVFHMNDYPAVVDRNTLTDSMRVMPGDGAAPLGLILNTLAEKNNSIVLSLELFNEDVWNMDATVACKLGLAKMKTAVEKAMSLKTK
jgi:2-keto-myo-inositol isomerase